MTDDDARFERAKELLRLAREAYENEVLDQLADTDDGTAWPGGPARPLYWHPWYRGKTYLLEWLNSDDRGAHLVALPPRMAFDETAATVADVPSFLTLTKHRAAAFAPYVGRPFRYAWVVATDEYGRSIASEARIIYPEGERR